MQTSQKSSDIYQILTFQQSSESCIQSEISSISSHSQLPITIQISFQKELLNIDIKCQEIIKSPYSYQRHYLILDIQQHNIQTIKKIIQIYFQQLEKGDLIFIISVSGYNQNKWIEKTKNNKINPSNFINFNSTQHNNQLLILDTVSKQSLKYSNMTTISIFLDCLPTQDVLNSIQTLGNKNQAYFHLFYFKSKQRIKTLKEYSSLNIQMVSNTSIDNNIKLHLKNLARIRIQKLTLSLQCLNGSLFRSDFNSYSWTWKQNKWIKTIRYLQSNNTYNEKLEITQMSKNIQIVIGVECLLMDGNKSTTYTTLNIFKSSKQNDKDKACSYIIPNEKLKLEILQCNSIPNIQFAHNKQPHQKLHYSKALYVCEQYS